LYDGNDGLSLFSSVTIAHEAKITDKVEKRKKHETSTTEQKTLD